MTVLVIPFLSHSQTTPLATPAIIEHPGTYTSFEKLLKFDQERFEAKETSLEGRNVTGADLQGVQQIDLDPDFLNSIMLNTPSEYLSLAARNKCGLYDTLVADLLRLPKGKVDRIFIQYQNKEGARISATMSKNDFLETVVYPACPETKALIPKFQIRTLDSTIKAASFPVPTTRQQCEATRVSWLENPQTPYWCQVHEVIEEADNSSGPVTEAVRNKQAVARILKSKLSEERRDYISNVCRHTDNPELFCDAFLSGGFFRKIVEKGRSKIPFKDFCQEALKTTQWSEAVLGECLRLVKKNPDTCLWGIPETSGLSPRPRCDHISLALNHSSLMGSYNDCPRNSDNQAVTNLARLLIHTNKTLLLKTGEACSALSAGIFLGFNRRFDNEASWTAGACYMDRVEDKERCLPAFFGEYGDDAASMPRVLEEILFRTKGAPRDVKCQIVSNTAYNPTLLEFRYGCFIVYNPANCGLAQCEHKVVYNEREVKDIKLRGQLTFDYFPTTLTTEKYSQTYILQRDAKKKTREVQTLPAIEIFFKENPKGVIHGVGCAEDLLPSFFRKQTFNQCTPLPFIVDGIIRQGDRIALVTRSAADNVHAPRLISWGLVFSAVKTYQWHHPLKLWTLHAIN